MAYVKSFKSFQNAEKKAADDVEAGANPVVAEQSTPTAQPATQTQPANQTTPTQQPAQAPSVESNPDVVAARKAAADARANADRAIAAKETELAKLKADQEAIVNRANASINTALQQADTVKA